MLKDKKIVVIGAGITGLCAAYFFNKKKINYKLFEKNNYVGGYASSVKVNDFIFDYGEHFVRIPDRFTKDFFSEVMGNRIQKHHFRAKIYIYGRYVDYPFQKYLYELPLEVKEECILEFVRKDYDKRIKRTPRNFYDWILKNYGYGIARHFMVPYNHKIWTVHPRYMSYKWMFNEKVVPKVSFKEILEGAFIKKEVDMASRIRWYPKTGGISEIGEAIAARLKSGVSFNYNLERVDIKNKVIYFENGYKDNYDILISTVPINELIKKIRPVKKDLIGVSNRLRYNSALIINFGLKSSAGNKNNWLYFPEYKYIFSRIFYQKNFSSSTVPKDKDSVSVIMTYRPERKIKIKDVIEKSINDLICTGHLKSRRDIIFTHYFNIELAFPIPTLNSDNDLRLLHRFLNRNDVYSIGRYGNWQYSGIEHAVRDGKDIVDLVIKKYGTN